MRWQLTSVIPVWIIMAFAALAIGLLSPANQYLTWLPIALAGGIFVTFCIQLAIAHKEGLVDRMVASLGGSVLILAIATAILGPLAL
ncbi:MAG: hypothetical protein ACYCZY_05960 [Lacisediminihabitans sp.]